MSVYLRLSVAPSGIDPDEWVAVYGDSLKLLRACPDPLLRLVRHRVAGHEVLAYTTEIERDDELEGRGWKVEGDLGSRRTAESFEMRAALERNDRADEVVDDIFDPRARVHRVFDAKTQGEPYHLPLLAVAMMVEARFSRFAFAHGDLDASSADQAASYVERVLGERPPPPCVLDAERLRERLSAVYPQAEVDTALEEHLIRPAVSTAAVEWLHHIARPARGGMDDESLRDLAASGTPDGLSSAQRLAFEAMVQRATRTRSRVLEACRGRMLEALAIAAARQQIVLTVRTWDQLATEPEDQLAMLLGLATLASPPLPVVRIRHAIFENELLRRHAGVIARDET